MKIQMNATRFRRLSVLGSSVALAAAAFSCSSTKDDPGIGPQGSAAAPAAQGGSGPGPVAGGSSVGTAGTIDLGDPPVGEPGGPCKGLECKVPACTGMPPTTITGKVYDPAGKVPLYNVLVYVPNSPVVPLTEGAKCDRCDASVLNPVTSAVTDETGTFVLKNAPADANVPIVIQVGKWRRQITVPSVAPCADTALTDPQLTRLPRNKSEGDIPRIAITTGSSDQMECLPLRLGIDAAEFTTGTGDGRIHLYSGDYDAPRGGGGGGTGGGGGVGIPGGGGQLKPLLNFDATINGGAMLTPADALWASADNLKKYDIVIMSCEGNEYANQKPAASRQALYEYASLGGRVFASHFHHIWFSGGPAPVPTTGTWQTRMPNPAGTPMNPTGGADPITATINTSFPKGAALAKWLVNVGASSMLGQMDLVYPRDNIQAVNPAVATEWITVDNPNFSASPKAVQYMSFNTPIGAAEDMICGREVYTNVHVASVDVAEITPLNQMGFPASCEKRDLSPQEKAVAFMLFDLSACVQSEVDPPKPPR